MSPQARFNHEAQQEVSMMKEAEMEEPVKSAYETAKRNLRSNYRRNGVNAGHNQFSDFWTRDFCFASFGMTKLGDYDMVKRAIENYLKNQKPDGMIPFIIGTKHFMLKYLGFQMRDKSPAYGDHKSRSAVIDQNPLIVIASLNYVKESKDNAFAKRHFEELKKTVDWCISRCPDDSLLIEERYFANWADSVKKNGKVLYTNVCFFKAVEEFAELCRISNEKVLHVHYKDLARKIKSSINEEFWNGKYYSDWIEKGKKHDFFATDGNVLAIMWGISDKDKAKKILSYIDKIKIDHPVPCRTNYPGYPSKYESMIMRLILLEDYHNNSLAWLWLGCCLAIAKDKAGMKEEARQTLKRIAEVINRYRMVYEVYESNGQPVRRLIYKSETHFSWSSGMFIYAASQILSKSSTLKEQT